MFTQNAVPELGLRKTMVRNAIVVATAAVIAQGK